MGYSTWWHVAVLLQHRLQPPGHGLDQGPQVVAVVHLLGPEHWHGPESSSAWPWTMSNGHPKLLPNLCERHLCPVHLYSNPLVLLREILARLVVSAVLSSSALTSRPHHSRGNSCTTPGPRRSSHTNKLLCGSWLTQLSKDTKNKELRPQRRKLLTKMEGSCSTRSYLNCRSIIKILGISHKKIYNTILIFFLPVLRRRSRWSRK